MTIIQDCIDHLKGVLSKLIHQTPEASHSVDHMIAVYQHAKLAVEHCDLAHRNDEKTSMTDAQRLVVLLAVLLHDADDPKLFPHHTKFRTRTIDSTKT